VFNSLSDHRFSHSMSTRELNIRFHLFDGFLDTFSCGLGRVRGHVSRASFVGPQFCSCDSFIGSSHVVPLDILVMFLMIALILFLELILCGMFLRETQDFIFEPNFASC
jgi:hypothetical protein